MTFCGNLPTRPLSVIQRGYRVELKWFVMQLGSLAQWRISDFLTLRSILSPILKPQSPKSRGRDSSRLRGASIVRTMSCSCAAQAEKSHSYGNTSIPCVRPRRWTHRSLISNPEIQQRGFPELDMTQGSAQQQQCSLFPVSCLPL